MSLSHCKCQFLLIVFLLNRSRRKFVHRSTEIQQKFWRGWAKVVAGQTDSIHRFHLLYFSPRLSSPLMNFHIRNYNLNPIIDRHHHYQHHSSSHKTTSTHAFLLSFIFGIFSFFFFCIFAVFIFPSSDDRYGNGREQITNEKISR